MDGLTTLKELSRMCETTSCCKCGLMIYNNGLNLPCAKMLRTRPEEVYAVVEQWSKENPIKTNLQKFAEVFGCVVAYQANHARAGGLPEEWWNLPYEAPKV